MCSGLIDILFKMSMSGLNGSANVVQTNHFAIVCFIGHRRCVLETLVRNGRVSVYSTHRRLKYVYDSTSLRLIGMRLAGVFRWKPSVYRCSQGVVRAPARPYRQTAPRAPIRIASESSVLRPSTPDDRCYSGCAFLPMPSAAS